jgi:hypothetical protein
MKKLFTSATMLLLLTQCNNHSSSAQIIEESKMVAESIKAAKPGTVATSENGYYMKAKINGKDWEASSMMPPEMPSRIIGYYNDESISFPYDRRDMRVGKKTNFENSGVDLFLSDDVGIWGGHTGEMEITKADEISAEGKFFFTATAKGTDKKIQVTEGSFRILFDQKKQ